MEIPPVADAPGSPGVGSTTGGLTEHRHHRESGNPEALPFRHSAKAGIQKHSRSVIPAKAGIQGHASLVIPAKAGIQGFTLILPVIPAKAGIQGHTSFLLVIPAKAGIQGQSVM
jgi:hypothetical protein